jgi:hypothetical protein
MTHNQEVMVSKTLKGKKLESVVCFIPENGTVEFENGGFITMEEIKACYVG